MKLISLGGLEVSRIGLGAMTMAGTYTSDGAARRLRVHPHHPPRPRPRRHPHRHRRDLRAVPQRGSRRPGRQGPPRPGRRSPPSSASCPHATATGTPRRDRQQRGERPRRRRGLAASASAPTTSTSTTSTGSTRTRRSRRPQAPSPTSSPRARSSTSGCPRPAPATIRRAHAVQPVSALQTEYSLWTRDVGGRDPAAPARARHRLRALLTARSRPAHRTDPHRRRLRRRRLAQDQPPLHRRELRTATSPSSTRSRAIGAEIGATPAQTALAWLLTRGDDIAPIPGTRRVARVEENTAADSIELTADQLHRLDSLSPPPANDTTKPTWRRSTADTTVRCPCPPRWRRGDPRPFAACRRTSNLRTWPS